METRTWVEVEDYFTDQLVRQDKPFTDALKRQDEEGLPNINVPSTQGKLLYLLAKMIRAKDVLEIGTLGGYSTMWLAKAVADGGKVTSLEVNPRHAKISTENIERAGLSGRVDIIVGAAKDTMSRMVTDWRGRFDLVFIDADKENNPVYFDNAVEFARPGSIIVVDNVVRNGKVLLDGDSEPSVVGTRLLIEHASRDARVESTAIQTVSGKGYDGFMVVRVKD